MKTLHRVGGKEVAVTGRLLRIARLAAERYEFLDDPPEFIAALRECGARIDLFTFTRGLSQIVPKHDYPMETDNVAALPVSTFDDWWTKQINNKTRNIVRRAEKKGVVVREVAFDDALVRGIWSVYNDSPVRQGKAFWHYGKDLETVRRENGTFLDRSVFFGAFLRGQLIGFAKLVSDEHHQQAALMQVVSMIRHRDSAPTNTLIAQAVRSCADRAIPYLVYAKFAYGKRERDSLTEFKQHNGFRRVDVPRYYVPLTLAGRFGLRCGLHRPLAERLPETVLRRLRDISRRWRTNATSTTSTV